MTTTDQFAEPVPVPVDGALLRSVCGHFATGVTVITAGAGDEAGGTTVNSFTSVSLDPPLVLFCLHNQSRLRPTIEASSRFAVNFLSRPQERLAWAFAGRQSAVLDDVPHHTSDLDLPVLSGALAFIGCEVVDTVGGGDHQIYLGRVRELAILQHMREPLIFFRGLMGALADDRAHGLPIWDG